MDSQRLLSTPPFIVCFLAFILSTLQLLLSFSLSGEATSPTPASRARSTASSDGHVSSFYEMEYGTTAQYTLHGDYADYLAYRGGDHETAVMPTFTCRNYNQWDHLPFLDLRKAQLYSLPCVSGSGTQLHVLTPNANTSGL